MVKLIWSPRAAQDLSEICDYIARDSDEYARAFATRAVAIVETLPQQPLLGAKVPEYDRDDLRERLLHNYRIVYRIRPQSIEVVSIVHGARLFPTDLISS